MLVSVRFGFKAIGVSVGFNSLGFGALWFRVGWER